MQCTPPPPRGVQSHDRFNLVALPVVAAACLATQFGALASEWATALLIAYIAFDFCWIAADRTAVPRLPGLMLAHHAVTLALLAFPALDARRFGRYTALDGVVEVNTVFLIARRTFPLPAARPAFAAAYWATFAPLRLVLYPWVWLQMAREGLPAFSGMAAATRLPPAALRAAALACQGFLVAFNWLLLWITWPRQRRARKGTGEATGGVPGTAAAAPPTAARPPRPAASSKRLRAVAFHADGRVRFALPPRIVH